jgi:hypothetical protein
MCSGEQLGRAAVALELDKQIKRNQMENENAKRLRPAHEIQTRTEALDLTDAARERSPPLDDDKIRSLSSVTRLRPSPAL